MKYYVYTLIDPRTNIPFYVGKGQGTRAEYHTTENKKGNDTENPYKDRVIRNILNEDLEPTIEYVYWTTNENTAYQKEAEIIKRYGRKRFDPNGILTNLCEDNRPPNQKGQYTDERKQVYRERLLGNTLNTGRKQSDEEKERRSKSLQKTWDSGKRIVTQKMRDASSRTHKNKIVSNETRQKMSKSALKAKAYRRGKTNEEIFGKEKAEEIKIKKSKHPPPNRKQITINGITYSSIREASKKLNVSEYKAKKMKDV